MELHQLRYFLAATEAGTFSRAAKQCGIAQPSLSQQIKKLELSLGVSLFDRLGRSVALTTAGELLRPRARRILNEVNDARRSVREDPKAGFGPLAIGAIPTIGPFLLPPLLPSFIEEYPDCTLSMTEDLTDRLVEQVVNLELDCAIMSTPIDNELIELEVLAQEELLVAVPEDEVDPEARSIQISSLRGRRAVLLDEEHCLGEQVREFCQLREMNPQVVFRGAQLATVQRLVALGMGYSLIPEMMARDRAVTGCRILPLARNGPKREIAVVWRRDRTRSFLALQMVERVRAQLAVD